MRDDAEKFNDALREMPRGEFWKAKREVFEPEGPAMRLFRFSTRYPKSAPPKPRNSWPRSDHAWCPFRTPTYVQVYNIEEELVEPGGKFWLPMHDQLTDPALREFICELTGGAPDDVSLLRRIDVSVWMHVNDRKKAARAVKKKKRG